MSMKTLWVNDYVHYFDHGMYFHEYTHISKYIKLYTLCIFCLFQVYLNTIVTILKNKNNIKEKKSLALLSLL